MRLIMLILTILAGYSMMSYDAFRSVSASVVDPSQSFIAVDGKCVNGSLTINVHNYLWEDKYVYVHVVSSCQYVNLDSRVFAVAPTDSVVVSGSIKNNVTEVPILIIAKWDGGSAILKFNVRCNP